MLTTDNIIHMITNVILVFIFLSMARICNILKCICYEMNRRKNIMPRKMEK